MSLIQGLIAFVGRFFLSLIFIASGINQLLNWHDTQMQITNILHDWVNLAAGMDFIQNIVLIGLSSVPFLLIAAIFCQVIGGLCVLLGIQVRLGAFLLIVFLVP